MKRGTMNKKAFEAAAYAKNGEPVAWGPRCATCGDLAAWGSHPLCERKRGKLVVWVDEPEARPAGKPGRKKERRMK